MLMQSVSLFSGRLAGLFALALLGWFLVRRERLSMGAAESLAYLVVDVTLPALIFIGITTFSTETLPWGPVMMAGLGVSLVGLGLGLAFARGEKPFKKGTFLFCVAVANSSFLPLPLTSAIWGSSGTQYCLIYVLGNNLFLLSIGIGLMASDGGGEKKSYLTTLFTHPQSVAAMAGLAWRLSGLDLPQWAFWSLNGLGQSTIPLAMVAIGGLMAATDPKTSSNKGVFWTIGILKLAILPLLALLSLKWLGIKGVFAGVVLLEASMPTLATAAAYASRFGGDPLFAAKASFWTSLGALVTFPLFLALGSLWGLY